MKSKGTKWNDLYPHVSSYWEWLSYRLSVEHIGSWTLCEMLPVHSENCGIFILWAKVPGSPRFSVLQATNPGWSLKMRLGRVLTQLHTSHLVHFKITNAVFEEWQHSFMFHSTCTGWWPVNEPGAFYVTAYAFRGDEVAVFATHFEPVFHVAWGI